MTLAPGSLLGTGGGMKEAYATGPAEIRQDLQRAFRLTAGSRCPSATSTAWLRPTGRRCSARTAATTSRPGCTRSPSTTMRPSRGRPRRPGCSRSSTRYGGGDLFPAFFRTADRVTLVRGTTCPCGDRGSYLEEGSIRRMDLAGRGRMRGPGVNGEADGAARRAAPPGAAGGAAGGRAAPRRGRARRPAPAYDGLLAAGGAARPPHHRRHPLGGGALRRGRECGTECAADEPGAVTARWPLLTDGRVGRAGRRAAGRPGEGPARAGVLGASAGGAGRGRPPPVRPGRPLSPGSPAGSVRLHRLLPGHDRGHPRRSRPVGPGADDPRPSLPARQGLRRAVAEDARSAGPGPLLPAQAVGPGAGWVPVAWEMPLYRADVRPRSVLAYGPATSPAARSR